MRNLLYVPIIHEEADMGSAGTALAQKGAALMGEERWLRHQQTMRAFWERIESFLLSLDAGQLQVYQDGLAAEGKLGRRIVEEAARRGSRNYQLVLNLLERGAKLQKTENPALLLQEHQRILSLAHQQPAAEDDIAMRQHQRLRDHLLAERDCFIAQAINTSLGQGEMGVLFIGAQHNIAPYLPGDVSVVAVKNREKTSDYFAELINGKSDDTLAELAGYLVSPVDISHSSR